MKNIKINNSSSQKKDTQQSQKRADENISEGKKAINAAQFYQGGIMAYNIGQKYRHLFVEPIHAGICNCVSEKIAREMALNSCKMFNSILSSYGMKGLMNPLKVKVKTRKLEIKSCYGSYPMVR